VKFNASERRLGIASPVLLQRALYLKALLGMLASIDLTNGRFWRSRDFWHATLLAED
jgi:hypothetical protein